MKAHVHSAHLAIRAIGRGLHGWLRCLPAHPGEPHTLANHVRARWRLRPGRRVITRAEKQLGLDARWHP